MEERTTLLVGIDWGEEGHQVSVMDEGGEVLAERTLPDTLVGVEELHALVADLSSTEEPQVVVGIETERGLFVRALLGAGYQVYALNPKAVDRYRDRHRASGKKDDRADAKVLADAVRTDRHNHQRLVPDSEEVQALETLARAHKRLVWSRRREANRLRTHLREFYPQALEAFLDLADRDALALLAAAPTPAQASQLSEAAITRILRRAGRKRYLRTASARYAQALRQPHLEVPQVVAEAHGAAVVALVEALSALQRGIERLAAEMEELMKPHPDAEIYLSQPGLGPVLGARVLGEFGDVPNRYRDARARKNAAGTSPITFASGRHQVVRRRFARNVWLADAAHQWAVAAIRVSPGARAYYGELLARGHRKPPALRQVANRLVGILHGCLKNQEPYDEAKAWPRYQPQDLAA